MKVTPMKKGVLLLLFTAVLWSLGGLWVKFIDWNPVTIAGARSLIAFLASAAVMPKALDQLSWSRCARRLCLCCCNVPVRSSH
jgi:drug/metabolite transporter (DMT)-like permease